MPYISTLLHQPSRNYATPFFSLSQKRKHFDKENREIWPNKTPAPRKKKIIRTSINPDRPAYPPSSPPLADTTSFSSTYIARAGNSEIHSRIYLPARQSVKSRGGRAPLAVNFPKKCDVYLLGARYYGSTLFSGGAHRNSVYRFNCCLLASGGGCLMDRERD